MEYSTSNVRKPNVICNKNDIILIKNKGTKGTEFIISFLLRNPNINIANMVNLKLYELMIKLNNDIIHDFKLVNKYSEESADFLITFNPIGSLFGISQRFMYTNVEIKKENNTIILCNKSIPIDGNIKHFLNNKWEELKNIGSRLTVELLTENIAKFNFTFYIDKSEELPTCMENVVGLLCKSSLLSVKTFIENTKM